MDILELEYPGTFIEMDNTDTAWDIKILMMMIEDEFTDANMSLLLFQSEQHNQMTRSRNSLEKLRNSDELDIQYFNKLMEEYHKALGDSKFYSLYSEILEQVNRQVKRKKWESGDLPSKFQHKIIFIYIKSFIQAIDYIEKLINVLSTINGVPNGINTINEEFKEEFKNLRKIRNSEQHLEDRIRGIGPHGNKINLKPINNEFIETNGATNVLAINNINGTKFGTVIDTGEYAEIDISLETLVKVRDFIQRVINIFSWSGSKTYFPE